MDLPFRNKRGGDRQTVAGPPRGSRNLPRVSSHALQGRRDRLWRPVPEGRAVGCLESDWTFPYCSLDQRRGHEENRIPVYWIAHNRSRQIDAYQPADNKNPTHDRFEYSRVSEPTGVDTDDRPESDINHTRVEIHSSVFDPFPPSPFAQEINDPSVSGQTQFG
jgi:hypothetical protein